LTRRQDSVKASEARCHLLGDLAARAAEERPSDLRQWAEIERTLAGRPRLPQRRWLVVVFPALAGVALWVAAGRPLGYRPQDCALTSDSGLSAPESRECTLASDDGTRITLGKATRGQLRALGRIGAELVLQSGHADLSVVHRPGVRWEVLAGHFKVRVTGTRFDVGWAPEKGHFSLGVSQGEVSVSGGSLRDRRVRAGETVVPGLQNQTGTLIMTIADMSLITAEVKVDETDIVNVHLGQPADVTIDAIPHKIFHGVVSEIGDNAIVRSTGVATSQSTSTSEEAKDFKVVVTLTDPPADLRPGLSSTAKITTATRGNVLSIPIQALTVRNAADLEPKDLRKSNNNVQAAASAPAEASKQKEEVQGVFVIRNKKAEFVAVETGISGTTDIEVVKGLQDGDEVITGSYKVLRTLKPGTSVKIDNSAPKKEDESS